MTNLVRFLWVVFEGRILGRLSVLRVVERIPQSSVFWRAARYAGLNVAVAHHAWDRAADLVEEPDAVAEGNRDQLHRFATIALNARRPALAQSIYSGLAATEPGDQMAAVGLGRCAYYEGRFDEARTHFRHVLMAETNHKHALVGYGLAAFGLGDYADAEPFLRRAVELEGTDDYARFALGIACLRQGDTVGAMGQLMLLRGLNSERAEDLQRAIDGA